MDFAWVVTYAYTWAVADANPTHMRGTQPTHADAYAWAWAGEREGTSVDEEEATGGSKNDARLRLRMVANTCCFQIR